MAENTPDGLKRAVLATLGGTAVVLGFPPFTFFPPLLVIGPALLLVALRGVRIRRALWLGALFGGVIQAGGFSWLAGTVTRFYGTVPHPDRAPSESAAFWLGIGAFIVWWLGSTFAWSLFAAAASRRPRRPWIALLWPVLLWMTIEALYPRVFPWCLGAGFIGWGATAQGAWYLGVEGLSGFALLLASLLANGWLERAEGRDPRRHFAAAAALAVLLLGLGGIRATGEPDGETDTIRLGYVQAGISLARRHAHDRSVDLGVRREIEERTAALIAAEDPDLVVWSEGMFPGFVSVELFRAWVAQEIRHPFVIGGLGVEHRSADIHNRLFIALDADAARFLTYDKIDRVPFGEYFPARGFLESIGVPLPPAPVAAGSGRIAFEVEGVPIGPSICFEGILPGTADSLREVGARLHLNVTEDLWYGNSGAPHQHLALTRMRAIEAGLPLVRVTNGGITVATDSRGRTLAEVPLEEQRSGVFELEVPRRLESRPWTSRLARHVPWVWVPILVGLALERARRRSPGRISKEEE